jgi:PAS domain S-box-containing protein
MKFKDTRIQRKLMTVILLTSGVVMFLTCASFFAYEFVTFRQTTIRQLSAIGEIIANNSTGAIAFDSRDDAYEILASLKAEKHIVAAALYDKDGSLFSYYPSTLQASAFPKTPGLQGYVFENSHLVGFQSVFQGSRFLGTLYLQSDMGAMYERFRLYGSISILVIVVSFLVAYFLSKRLQEGISTPIIALAETAKLISTQNDYSVRATKMGEDELGLLTDSFNYMLTQIQAQNLALSESEARVRAVLNSAMSAVIVIDSEGLISDWNMRAEKMFGWTRDEVIGKELAGTIIPERYREAHKKGIHHYMAKGEGPVIDQFLELSAVRSDGSEFPVELTISVLKTKNIVSFCGFVTDITERKQAQEQIRSLNLGLEQKVKERTKELEAFTYSVSHDLRAPLRSVYGYARILDEDYGTNLDEEGKRVINVIVNNAKRMGQLIDDLLDFSRMGRKELMKASFNMNDLVIAIVNELRAEENGREIKIAIQQLESSRADLSMIRQVWVNLISNALKYSRRVKDAAIEIGGYQTPEETCYYVKDNGAGFDMQYSPKLFEVFQRLHRPEEFEGTGVGLALVKRIIERHGGRVWAEAKLDHGATFYFTLPRHEENSSI